jgi:hypothetical protein
VNYRLLIDYEVIEFLETLSRRERLLLRNRFIAIKFNRARTQISPNLTKSGALLRSTFAENTPSNIGKITLTGT